MFEKLKEKLIKCTAGEHEFEEIYSIEFEIEDGELAKEVINWCMICGAITVDLHKDGNIYPGEIVELVQPDVLKMVQIFYN